MSEVSFRAEGSLAVVASDVKHSRSQYTRTTPKRLGEQEQQATHATIFAEWPAVAAFVAGYLLLDIRCSSNEEVQTLPRRRHEEE